MAVVRRQNQDAVRPCPLHPPRYIRAHRAVVAGAGHHRHPAVHGLHGGPDDLFDFIGRHRIHFARTAGRHHGAERIPRHLVDILGERIKVQRKIAVEGRDGKAEDASKGGGELSRSHVNLCITAANCRHSIAAPTISPLIRAVRNDVTCWPPTSKSPLANVPT